MTSKETDQQLAQFVKYAHARVPALQKRFADAGLSPDDIQSVADLPKLPVLAKDAVVALQQADPPFGGMLAVPMSEIEHIFFSPGPIYEPGPPADDPAWDVAIEFMRRAGFKRGDVVLNSLSYHLVPAGAMFDETMVRLGCTVIPAGVGNTELQVKMMRDIGVTGYVGTPSFLLTLIQKAEELGYDFKKDFKVTKAMVTAEPLPPSMHQNLVETYGIQMANAYASADFGIIATGFDATMMMRMLDHPIIEVVDLETGQPVGEGDVGEVVVTNFNKVYPLIRLGTGDMAVNIDPNPGLSKQEGRALILVGRSGEAVKVRGMFVHPNQLRFAAAQLSGITAVRGVVTRPDLKDYFEVHVECAATVVETDIVDSLKTAVRSACRVRVDAVKFFPTGTIKREAPGMVDNRSWD